MEYRPRLKKKYQTEVVNNLKGNYKSVMQVPRLVKICLNQGIGKAASDKKQIEAAQQEMTLITGQKAMLVNSTKDISNFKLRKGMPVGVMVTLRGNQMYEFLDRFITSTMPRIRDFNGISDKGFDGRGNYTMGIKEQIAFPEISIDKISNITGMDITFVTNTDSNTEALALLKELGLPFKKNDAAEKAREYKIEKVKEEQRREAEKQEKLEASGEENTDSEEGTSDSQEEINTLSNSTDKVVEEKDNTTDFQESETEVNNQDLSEDPEKSES
jgi:large subunit ribosomal protein L5